MEADRRSSAVHSVFDEEALRNEFQRHGINGRFITLIWKHILLNENAEAHEVPGLPTAAYDVLRTKFKAMTSTLKAAIKSKDQLTTKLLIQLQVYSLKTWNHGQFLRIEEMGSFIAAGQRKKHLLQDCSGNTNGFLIEAVIMSYDTRLGTYAGGPRPGGPRATLCVSSQVGCKMGCTFCATGSMGFKSNLSAGEIVEQLVHASRLSEIRNIVFMGMGEPLNNYAAVVGAVRSMTGHCFQLAPRRITISTVGVIHGINGLKDDLPNVNLAVSLHAPLQDVRCQIMPAARAFPLGKLMDTLRVYQEHSKRKIFIEYIMLDGINDQEHQVHQLGKLLETLEVVVNLIPFNPIGSISKYKTSSKENVELFQKILRGVYKIRTTVRQEMGQDISGACGQLVVNLSDKKISGKTGRRGETEGIPDIEDLSNLRL